MVIKIRSGKMTENNGYTTISIKIDTKTELESICPKGQTYDELIWNMVQAYRKTKQDAKLHGKSAKNNQAD